MSAVPAASPRAPGCCPRPSPWVVSTREHSASRAARQCERATSLAGNEAARQAVDGFRDWCIACRRQTGELGVAKLRGEPWVVSAERPIPELSTRTPDPGNAGGGSLSPTCSLILSHFSTPRWEEYMRHLLTLPVLLALLCAAYAGCGAGRGEEPDAAHRDGTRLDGGPRRGTDAEFEERYGARVSILLAGDAGSALNRAILAKGNPLGRRAVRRRQRVPEPGPRRGCLRALRAAGPG